jgi:hypothetical protein
MMRQHVTAAAVCAALIGSVPGAAITQRANAGVGDSGVIPPTTATRDVIIVLRDQLPSLPAVRSARALRAAALASAQSPILSELAKSGALKVHGFGLINAVAARVSPAEAEYLAKHPLVSAVVTDATLRMPPRARLSDLRRGVGGAASPEAAAAGDDAAASSLCNTLEPQALQLTRTAFGDSSVPQAQGLKDGNGAAVLGAGVRVAFIADGIDTSIAGFVRPDGTSVFFDYQDFSGDPAGTPTAGGEAFGDASTIAAQDLPNGSPLEFDISQFVNQAHPLPSPCNIRIRGAAPEARLAALKVFSYYGFTPESIFVQAVEWAVTHDDVDIINESLDGSFLGSYYPDNSQDPVSLANKAAVDAGVTVVISSADAGSAGTLGIPSTDSYVISTGATTQYRWYAQTASGGAPLAKGYLSDNISALSSGGFSQSGARTVSVVAPGDSSWALCSTNVALYQDCYNFQSVAAGIGTPSPIEQFGGTSEAAPLTSAAAALVIQAYRSTHRGADPGPALVKRIIMSTATDLGAPAYEQGAGLVNALAAVQAALSINDAQGAPSPQGASVLVSPSYASVMAATESPQQVAFTLTNTSSAVQHLAPVLQTLGAPLAGATRTVNLNTATDQTYIDEYGDVTAYVEEKFTVPADADHVDASIAFPNPPSGPVYVVLLSLLDPSGKLAAYSVPQGLSGYAHIDAVKPTPGVWTALVSTPVSGPIAAGYSGPVQFSWSAERFVNWGQVEPSSIDLLPGASKTLQATFNMPSEPGDLAAAIRFASSSSSPRPDIPVSLRTLIPMGATGGDFTGTLTGGNGRAYSGGPDSTYAFEVPAGVKNMSLTLEIPDSSYSLEGLLVDPNGMQLSVEGNIDPGGNAQYALQQFRANPQPGLWRFILVLNGQTSGNQTALPFTARIGFNSAMIAAPTLPDDASVQLSAHAGPVKVAVNVLNTGAVTEAFFADARLDTMATLPLPVQPCSGVSTLPGACGLFNVPTQVKSIDLAAQSPVPIDMDAFNYVGYGVAITFSPDLYARPAGHGTVRANLSEPEVPFGGWIVDPSLIGPFGPSGALTAPVTTGAVVRLLAFDSAVTADSGDIWADLTFGSDTYDPLVLAPGASGVINLTIAPDPAKIGQTVSGFVFIDTFNDTVFSGDEVVRIPYRYTVVP